MPDRSPPPGATRPRGRRASRVAIVLGIIVFLGAAAALRGRIVEAWRVHQFQAAPEAERWALAKELAGLGPRGREMAEEWYLEMFRSGKITTSEEPEVLETLGKIGTSRSVPVIMKHAMQAASLDLEFPWTTLSLIQERDPPGTLAAIIGVLMGGTEDQGRVRACQLLASLGPAASEARAPLEEVLADPDPEIRSEAAMALLEMGFEKDRILQVTLPIIRDRSVEDASSALNLIVLLEEDALPALPALITRLRYKCAEFPRLLEPLQPALVALGEGAIPSMEALLDDPLILVRTTGARALASFGPRALPATESLIRALRNESPSVAREAAYALGEIGPGARAAIPALLKILLGAEDPRDQGASIMALAKILPRGEMDPEVLKAIPEARKIVDDPNGPIAAPRTWAFAADFLIKVDPVGSAGLIKSLAAQLKERDFHRQEAALDALVPLGKSASEARASILELAFNEERLLSKSAKALAAIGLEDLGPVLKVLAEDSEERRIRAAVILAALGPAALPALPQLLECLKEPDGELRTAAAEAIGNIGPAAKEAVPLLEAGLRDRYRSFRRASAKALKRIRDN